MFLFFRIMNAYCKSNGIDRDSVCFMYNNKEVLGTDTSIGIGLKDGDTIDIIDR